MIRERGDRPDVYGVPRNYFALLRRAAEIPGMTLRWMFAIHPQKRFCNKCIVWREAGEIMELYRRSIAIARELKRLVNWRQNRDGQVIRDETPAGPDLTVRWEAAIPSSELLVIMQPKVTRVEEADFVVQLMRFKFPITAALSRHLNASGANWDDARQEWTATDPGQAGLTEEFDDRRHNIERTGNTVLAGGNVLTDDTEETIFAGVTSRSQIGERTDLAQTWMRKTERSAFPDDVDVRLTGTDIVRILLRTVDFGHEGLSVQEIAALRDNFTDLLTGLCIFGGSDLTTGFAPHDVDSDTSIVKRWQGERGHFRPEARIAGRGHPSEVATGICVGNDTIDSPRHTLVELEAEFRDGLRKKASPVSVFGD
jgi:hypothetical protein